MQKTLGVKIAILVNRNKFIATEDTLKIFTHCNSEAVFKLYAVCQQRKSFLDSKSGVKFIKLTFCS